MHQAVIEAQAQALRDWATAWDQMIDIPGANQISEGLRACAVLAMKVAKGETLEPPPEAPQPMPRVDTLRDG